ncbi:MAG: putative DNA binding domain-containing protein [Bacteroides sp.]|nr:putative DNA binding domain-containing protein [Ruminococcus flavefaciens]MCM1554194.1 putative DNA binding domain-containing protein [Bacteroides sp.]
MEKKKLTIEQLISMRESEDRVEFKACQQGNMSFNGVDKTKPSDRRKCILGYTVALSNAGGGYLVFGMHDAYPHKVVGTKQNENSLGQLENDIYKAFPQAKVMHEYRNTEGQERFDKRMSFGEPFYILIDKVWKAIDARNGNVPVQEGAYIFDIPFFNEEVIREVVNNAFAHRDYRLGSEIVIKQCPTKLSIVSPGGFPLGVTLDNILTVSSTPRNRLLADVLAMTGIVERSGQGMDVIFRLTLSEGKQKPDYNQTDDYQVTAILSATVKDPGFALFIKSIQQELPENQKLSVFDILTFRAIHEGYQPKDKDTAKRLFSMGFLEKRGKTSAIRYILPRRYYELTNKLSEYSRLTDWDDEQVWAVLFPYLRKYGKAKKADIANLIGNHISETQLRRVIERLTEQGMLTKNGKTTNTVYSISSAYLARLDVLTEATKIGLGQMKKDAGLSSSDGTSDGTRGQKEEV